MISFEAKLKTLRKNWVYEYDFNKWNINVF